MDFSRALCHTEFKPDEMFEHSELSRWSSILFKTFKLKASFESLDAPHSGYPVGHAPDENEAPNFLSGYFRANFLDRKLFD